MAGLELLEGYQALHRQLGQVRAPDSQETSKRDSLKNMAGCLGTWRKKLIAQLPVIYPITQVLQGPSFSFPFSPTLPYLA